MKINYTRDICRSVWMTMDELSQFTGIKGQRLRDISSGRVDGFKPEEMTVLVEKLHINYEWLMTGDGQVFIEGFERLPTQAYEVIKRICNMRAPENIGLSYDEVLDVSKGTVNKWLKKYTLPHWVIQKACDDLNATYDFIVYGIDTVISTDEKKVAKQTPAMFKLANANLDSFKPNAVDTKLLIYCLRAVEVAYGDEFASETAELKLEYAVDLYNLIVKMYVAIDGDGKHMHMLDEGYVMTQMHLFIKLNKVMRYPKSKMHGAADFF